MKTDPEADFSTSLSSILSESPPREVIQARLTVRLNCIYHEMCEAFFSRISQFASFLSILGGSSSVVAVAKLPNSSTVAANVIIIIGLLISIIHALMLSFRVQEKASIHRDLKRDYSKVWSDILVAEGSEGKLSREEFVRVERRISAIEDHEPPTLKWFKRRAEENAALSLGLKKKVKQ